MLETRYPCPVCLGLPMEKLHFQETHLTLDTCRRCGGMWFDYGEINRLKKLHPQMALKKVELRDSDYVMSCHQCSALLKRNADECEMCYWKNRLDCPVCQKQMAVVKVGDIKLDACKHCKGVWFDNVELSQIWNGRLARLTEQHKPVLLGDDDWGDDAAFLFLDILTFSPELAFYTAEAAVDVVTHAPELAAGAVELVANAPEIAGSLIEGTAEAAGGIFEAIASIIGGIFEGL